MQWLSRYMLKLYVWVIVGYSFRKPGGYGTFDTITLYETHRAWYIWQDYPYETHRVWYISHNYTGYSRYHMITLWNSQDMVDITWLPYETHRVWYNWQDYPYETHRVWYISHDYRLWNSQGMVHLTRLLFMKLTGYGTYHMITVYETHRVWYISHDYPMKLTGHATFDKITLHHQDK